MDRGRAVEHLEAFGERLRAGGWYARVLLRDGHTPVLRVVNPAALPLNDDVTAGQGEHGAWSFRWSFGVPIAQVDDLDVAATTITRVLACTGA